VSVDAASAAARASALVVAEPERGVLVVSGSERVSWLNGVVTCDVKKVSESQAMFGLLLSKVGKIQTDLYVASRSGELCLVLAPGTQASALVELERMLVMEDAELRSATEELSCVCVHGPLALSLAEQAAGGEASVAALDRTGLGGALLLTPREAAARVTERLRAAGAVVALPEDWQRLRVERRLGAFGVDYGPADNPHEAGLERLAVAWDKGCYLGQEVVFMQDARGKLKRSLALLELEAPPPSPGAPITSEAGASLGEVTSATESKLAGRALVLARVKAPHFEPGVRLTAGGVPAVVRGEPV
jgi:folate-binding protein YgfZ